MVSKKPKGLSKTINLVWPNDVDYVTGLFTPLGVGYLASYLIKKGINVKVHDLTFSKNIESGGGEAIYGISITTPISNFATEAIKQIKSMNKKNIIIVGGPHVTCLSKEMITNKMVDYAVIECVNFKRRR